MLIKVAEDLSNYDVTFDKPDNLVPIIFDESKELPVILVDDY